MQAAQTAPSDPERDAPTTSAGSVDDRISNRVPLERQVAVRFEDFDDFVTACSMNISATGMFIHCSDPQPAGSVLDFKFALADGERLISGYGEVIWARRRDDGPERPAGMGIRFLHLDAESRELIRWTVTRRYITGAGPCDVDEVRSAMRQAAEREAAEQAERPSPRPTNDADSPRPARDSSPRSRYLEAGYAAAADEPPAGRSLRLVAACAALTLGGLYLLQATSTSVGAAPAEIEDIVIAQPSEAVSEEATPASPAVDAVGATPASPAIAVGAPPAAPAVAAPGAPASPEIAGVGATSASPEVPLPEDAVKDWARAWSRQEAADYLALYATDFRPASGSGRDAWEKQRRLRIARPRWIQIELGALVTEVDGTDHARVTFDQSYRSDTYHDVVRKTLVMVREDAGWRILEERAS